MKENLKLQYRRAVFGVKDLTILIIYTADYFQNICKIDLESKNIMNYGM